MFQTILGTSSPTAISNSQATVPKCRALSTHRRSPAKRHQVHALPWEIVVRISSNHKGNLEIDTPEFTQFFGGISPIPSSYMAISQCCANYHLPTTKASRWTAFHCKNHKFCPHCFSKIATNPNASYGKSCKSHSFHRKIHKIKVPTKRKKMKPAHGL